MSGARPRLILFDVDGTLVHAGGAGRAALDRALVAHVGRSGLLDGLRLDGMTDRLIVREALRVLGRPFEDDLCDAVLASYVRHLAEELRRPQFRVLPGVAALLERLRARGANIALGTGNVEDGARLKLARGGIDAFFSWGEAHTSGFGGDGEAREEILRAALRRAAARLGAVEACEVLVVGDTPRDVEAARAVGCRVVAVATGRHALAELSALRPDVAVGSLEEPGAIRELFGD